MIKGNIHEINKLMIDEESLMMMKHALPKEKTHHSCNKDINNSPTMRGGIIPRNWGKLSNCWLIKNEHLLSNRVL